MAYDNETGTRLYCVRTVDDGVLYIWADGIFINENGSVSLFKKTGEFKFPIFVVGPGQYISVYHADQKTKEPVGLMEWGEH